MKTTIGQIILGATSFILILGANIIHIKKREEPVRFIIFGNISVILLILIIVSNIYLERKDIALYLVITASIFVYGFCFIEFIIR